MLGVGAVLIAAAVIKLSVIGFYPDELVWIMPLLAVGAGLAWYGDKLRQQANTRGGRRDA
jgi:hypothetical protein